MKDEIKPLELMTPDELRAKITDFERGRARCRAELAKLEGEDPTEDMQSVFADWISRGDPIVRLRQLVEELERREVIAKGAAFYLETDVETLLVRELNVSRPYHRYDRMTPNELGGMRDFAETGQSKFTAWVYDTAKATELSNAFRAGRLRTIADGYAPDVPYCVLIDDIEWNEWGGHTWRLNISGHVALWPEEIARYDRRGPPTARNARLYVREEAAYADEGDPPRFIRAFAAAIGPDDGASYETRVRALLGWTETQTRYLTGAGAVIAQCRRIGMTPAQAVDLIRRIIAIPEDPTT